MLHRINRTLLALSVAIFLGQIPRAYSSQKDCVQKSLKAFLQHPVGKLPDSEKEFRSIFESAQSRYLKRADLKEMKSTVALIAEKGFGKVDPKKLDRLKSDRILTQQVRGSYTLFSLNHAPPKDFHHFVRDLGYLNDAIIENKPKKAQAMAKKVLEHMEKGKHLPTNYGFVPAVPGSVNRYALEKLEEIENLIKRPMDIHQYHDVKKDIRNFKFMYTILNKHFPHPDYARLKDKASLITDEMGKTKDFLFTDKSIDKKALVAIDPEIQREIKLFIDDFRSNVSKNSTPP